MAGCATKAKAEPLPESPPLVMPAPPPRVLAPVDQDLPVAEETPVTPEPAPAVPPPRTASRPTPSRPRTTGTPAEAASPPAESTPPPVAAAPAPEASRELRSVDAAAEQKVRDVLSRAAKDLSRVDYQKLTVDGKSQYDQSKRLAEQAEQALKAGNTVFAATVADKAATVAAELLGR